MGSIFLTPKLSAEGKNIQGGLELLPEELIKNSQQLEEVKLIQERVTSLRKALWKNGDLQRSEKVNLIEKRVKILDKGFAENKAQLERLKDAIGELWLKVVPNRQKGEKEFPFPDEGLFLADEPPVTVISQEEEKLIRDIVDNLLEKL